MASVKNESLLSSLFQASPATLMVGGEPGDDTDDCNFPSVRKTFWRSATWNASSTLPCEGKDGAVVSAESAPPCTPCSQEHNASIRARVPLLPLQPLSIARRSFDDWPSAGLDDSPDLTSPITPGRRRVKAGLDIKLDLASVHRSVAEPTEIQRRRDKLALFDKQCSRVAEYHIYLGSDAVARDREVLHANGITHILNCVGFVCPEYFKADFVYKTLWLQDSPCEDIISLLYDVFDYFEEVREQGDRVFVHCCQGVSRSTTLVIAYVMWKEHKSFEEAFQDVKAARGVANPNMGFACQLLQCQKRVHAAPISPKSALRVHRLAPHSPYDPLHLVLKASIIPGPECLDSRGAFIVHITCAIFVWVGQNCDPKMAQEAVEVVGQVIRYERADVLVKVIAEGNEGVDFWNAFTDYSKMCRREEVERVRQAGIGSRKVSSNDTDYSLYHIARLGGVIPPVPFSNGGMGAIPTSVPVHDDGWSMLRRKVMSRDLAYAKQSLSASPNISMGSSSPHFSPFSVASVSSSTPAGSDSSFDSPVSSMCTLSPCTPEGDLPASVSCYTPFINSLQYTPSLKISAGPCVSKVLASSLAERRGSLPPCLQLPGLDDVPPPAPRGASRKPRLPPLVMKESCKTKSTGNLSEDKNLMLVDTLGGAANFAAAPPLYAPDRVVRDESYKQIGNRAAFPHARLTTANPEKGSSTLYLWPGLEQVDLFDADDLDTKGVFLLVETRFQRVAVHVWVGCQLAANKQIQGKASADAKEVAWHHVGQDFVGRMQLPSDASISVVQEGQEPEEFWEAFSHG
ncbi:hypothetical protein GOP47_0027439 [Adiantum capillus-veneris]|nr:hypothetical protein GOP47_0027439 [Adiantum capillus-veneris]